MPVAWEQLTELKSGAQWTIATAREYLSFQKADPWAGYWTTRQTLAAGDEGARPPAETEQPPARAGVEAAAQGASSPLIGCRSAGASTPGGLAQAQAVTSTL